MEWERSSEAPEKLKTHLTQPEAHVMVQALVDYNLSRLQKGNSALGLHMSILGNITGNQRAGLLFETSNYRRLVGALIEYAEATPTQVTKSPEESHDEWMGFEDLATQRTQEGETARRLAEDFKSAVLEYEGRPDEQVTVDEFIHEN